MLPTHSTIVITNSKDGESSRVPITDDHVRRHEPSARDFPETFVAHAQLTLALFLTLRRGKTTLSFQTGR